MADTTTQSSSSLSDTSTGKNWQTAIARVKTLSIFFLGMGLFAILGFGLHYLGLFSSYQLTYFIVGAATGGIGLLLGLVTR